MWRANPQKKAHITIYTECEPSVTVSRIQGHWVISLTSSSGGIELSTSFMLGKYSAIE